MMPTIVVFAAVVAVGFAIPCHDDLSSCTITCQNGSRVACEHNTCKCAEECLLRDDCTKCPPHTDHMGNISLEEAHCYNGVCICIRPHPILGAVCKVDKDCPDCGAHTDPDGDVHHEQAICVENHCMCSQTTHHDH